MAQRKENTQKEMKEGYEEKEQKKECERRGIDYERMSPWAQTCQWTQTAFFSFSFHIQFDLMLFLFYFVTCVPRFVFIFVFMQEHSAHVVLCLLVAFVSFCGKFDLSFCLLSPTK